MPSPVLLELSTRREEPSLGLLTRLALMPLSLSAVFRLSRISDMVAPAATWTSMPRSVGPSLTVSVPALDAVAPEAKVPVATLLAVARRSTVTW
ncbi:hypothetical protein D9M69_499800 [compost metagenome]